MTEVSSEAVKDLNRDPLLVNGKRVDIKELVNNKESVVIAGHLRPDGDCVGACTAVYRYIRKCCPESEVHVYLSVLPKVFSYLKDVDSIFETVLPDIRPDVFIAVDTSSPDRLGEAEKIFHNCGRTVVIDHHVSNAGYGAQNFVVPDASSACEVIFDMMDPDLIDKDIADALYTGIVTDTGGFRYTATSRHTMEAAGVLMDKGIDHAAIMDRNLHSRTYVQAQILGRVLTESMLVLDKKCIIATVTQEMMNLYGAKTEDLEGVVDELRITDGVECAVLVQQTGDQEYKISMRSNTYVDVNKIAVYFEGGGHVMAAGCTMRGSLHDVINNIMAQVELQLK